MTLDEFEKLRLGDIVSHKDSPWACWIVYTYIDGFHDELLIIRCNGMKTETTRISNHDEWNLVSKVKERT